uniref:Uncharacterized protein n=1 Tax=viral metagenome TaxID=1070528 RepID=A0A6C0JK68_9ZZZZ
MSVPPALDLRWSHKYPGNMPDEPWPLGPHGSRRDGTPLLPGTQPTEEQVLKDKKEWAKAAAEYLVTLQKWIDENKNKTDPLMQSAVSREASTIPHIREKIAPYLE